MCITILCVPLQYQNKQTMKTTNNPEKELEVRLLGFTEEITECACCGKSDLKGTYALDINGDLTYFGSVCAFKLHSISYEEQKNVKKERKARMKAENKLNEMEANHNGTDYSLVKMLRFIESKNLNLNDFILKYGKKIDENDYYIAYSIGHVVKMINK